MRHNASLLECVYKRCSSHAPRIEIWDDDDLEAKHLGQFVNQFAKELASNYPDLKIYGSGKSDCLWNFEHPFIWGLFKGYIIYVDNLPEIPAIKEFCERWEIDPSTGKRYKDIDIYTSFNRKISRADLVSE
jgi:hypothetical protein